MHLVVTAGGGETRTMVSNGSSLLLLRRRIVLFLETFIDFRVVGFFLLLSLVAKFFFHAVAVSLSATSMHFRGALICDLQLKEEGKQFVREGVSSGFFFLSVFFLCSLYRSGGRKRSSYRENLVTSEGVFYFCIPKWFLLFSLKSMWLHLFFFFFLAQCVT